jgi:hypothetical protein
MIYLPAGPAGAGEWSDGGALAAAWLGERGFPEPVRTLLDAYEPFVAAQPLLAWVAPRAALGGPAVPRDLFVLAKLADGALAAIAVAGPADLRGPSIEDWLLADPSPARIERLQQLGERLGVPLDELRALSQPLLQRTAAALLEAERFNATHALMLAHACDGAAGTTIGRDERRALQSALGGRSLHDGDDGIVAVTAPVDIKLYLGWVEGER